MFVVTLDPATQYRCTKCPDSKNLRLWGLRPLQAHLADKYVRFSVTLRCVLKFIQRHEIKEDLESAYMTVTLSARTSDEIAAEDIHAL